MNRLRRAKEIQYNIALILLRDWDPLNVRDEPTCADEYDGYVGGVYRLLAASASPDAIAAHLAQVESSEMGYDRTDRSQLLSVARALCALDVSLGSR
ncbi:MAG: hypothetical protein ACO1Q7_07085 [Gemmatimonas sp.]